MLEPLFGLSQRDLTDAAGKLDALNSKVAGTVEQELIVFAWCAERVLNAKVNKMIVKPAYVQRFAGLGAEPLDSAPMETAAFIRAEQDKWGRVIREVGIKAE